jgi:peptide/nickel transport system permease protein
MKSALVVLVVLHAAILFAPWIAPYPYAEHHRDYPYSAPGRAGLASSPSRPLFLLGTDAYGRDIFSRVLYGGRISLVTGILATGVALGLGLLCGMLAGFYGGWVDTVLMRSAELFLALPWLYLLLGVRAALPLHITPVQAFLLLVSIIGGVGWVRPARLIRGVVLRAKEEPYVHAARGFGASSLYLMRVHILPQTYGVLLAQATVLIPRYVVAEVTLSFLGLGISEPIPSWGNMLSDARHYASLRFHPWLLSPALLLIPVLLIYLWVSDQLTQSQVFTGRTGSTKC